MQQVPLSKAKVQNNFIGSLDVAETHRKYSELSKGTSTTKYICLEKKGTIPNTVTND